MEALWLSLSVAFWSTTFGMPIALAVAWLLARRDFAGKALVSALVHLPLVLPPVVTGYALLILFSPGGVLGALAPYVAFRWTGAVIAASVMAFPLMVRAIRLALEAVDPGLEAAARTMGATRAGAFRRVTLPLIAPGLLAGAVMGFAKAIGEFGATITFVAAIPGETLTLPSAIYTALQVPGGEAVAARLSLIAAGVAIGAVILSELLARRIARRIGQAQDGGAP